MIKLKSERHHWWPRCVSRNWAASDGKTGWIKPDGTILRISPNGLGVIGNGHHIKLGRSAGDESPFDSSFEKEFDAADSNFPSIITWLEGLERSFKPDIDVRQRFFSQPATDDQLRLLTESTVSLAVRSPRNREASVALAENFRGNLSNAERNPLIGLNMRNSQRIIADSIGSRGKYAVLFSQGREFIFGDGFFHNVAAISNPPQNPKLLVPITPNISVIISRPSSFAVNPRLSTILLTDEEVDRCNHAVQVYSSTALFFKTEPPVLTEAFTCGKHLRYSAPDNPIELLIGSLPGVPPRDTSLDFLMQNRC